MQSHELKQNIMRRVYTVYLLKTVAQPLLFELALIAAFIGVAAFFISLKSVLVNVYSIHDIEAVGQFLFSAFIETQIVVKTIVVGVFMTLVVFIYDSVRRIRRAWAYRT
ncbi:hypothetical protein KW782_01225 [Candidatus Parcubacteria bacterium]|nr:hypothetical protein [Candidatus Parcubacteria bacterium]